jgi:hypothetical protein
VAAPDIGAIIDGNIAYANDAIATANDFIGTLRDSLGEDIAVDAGDFANPDFAVTTIGNIATLLNQLAGAAVTSPTITHFEGQVPAAPADQSFGAVPEVTVPEFTSSAPTLTMPTAPSGADTISAPAETSILDLPALDNLVDPTLPTVPTFSTVTIPATPTISIPVFNPLVAMPEADFATVTNNFSWAEAAYQTTLLDAATAKLLADLQNGGYGIETADEDALWERERARQIEATNFAIEEIRRGAAIRGFPLPPGDLEVSVQRAVQDASNKVSAVSRDIALKRADMFVENRKFTLQEVRAIETVLISFHNSRMERSLNAAKATVELGIAVFNASVARHNARLEAYKTEHVVFESKIRAALLTIEGHRLTIEGKKLELESQVQQVELYKAQLAGVNALVEIYKTKAQVQTERANIERLKIEMFRGRVDAYAAQVQAKVAQMNAYEAQVRGEIAKVQAYEAEARAYVAKVDGIKARAETFATKARVEIEQSNAKTRQFESKITGFRAEIDKAIEKSRSQVALYQGDVSNFSARSQAYVAATQAGLTQAKIEADMRFKALDVVIENAKIQLGALVKSAEIRLGANDTFGKYVAAQVSSAIGALNTITANIQNL